METKLTIAVEDAHTDSLGHLNHVDAVGILEQARDGWYLACGLNSESPHRYETEVVNINYDYRRECFIDEELSVITRPERMGKKSIVLSHEIIKPDGEIAVSGKATSVVMEMQERNIIPVPDCVEAIFKLNEST